MNSRIFKHSAFWIVITLFLTIYYGRVSGNFKQSFYFTTFLLPVTLATSYLFNYYLVPHYLLTKKLLKFSLYSLYTLIISLYFEMLVITLSFIVLANYQYDLMNPLTVDIFSLTITLYSIVFLIAFVRMYKAFQLSSKQQSDLMLEKEKNKQSIITIKSNRETIPIQLKDISHIESLADYVKIHTLEKSIITKEKISKIQEELPTYFLRVHRSFIVNRNLIDSYSKEKIKINDTEIPISRTYKKEVMSKLEKAHPIKVD